MSNKIVSHVVNTNTSIPHAVMTLNVGVLSHFNVLSTLANAQMFYKPHDTPSGMARPYVSLSIPYLRRVPAGGNVTLLSVLPDLIIPIHGVNPYGLNPPTANIQQIRSFRTRTLVNGVNVTGWNNLTIFTGPLQMQSLGYFVSSSIAIAITSPGVVTPLRLTWTLPTPVLLGESIVINMPGFVRQANTTDHHPQSIPLIPVSERDATAFFTPLWNPLTQQIIMTCKLSMPAGLMMIAQIPATAYLSTPITGISSSHNGFTISTTASLGPVGYPHNSHIQSTHTTYYLHLPIQPTNTTYQHTHRHSLSPPPPHLPPITPHSL